MTSKVCEKPDVRRLATFLTTYAAWLLGCGATCIRLQKNVGRIAAAFGTEVETTIMPRHLHMSFYDRETNTWLSTVTAPMSTPISFYINTRLSELSWQIADGKIHFCDAEAALEEAVTSPKRNFWLLLLLVCCANASFCRLFGGDAIAMGIVAVATLAGFWLKNVLCERGMDVRIVFFICALVSGVLGATGILFGLGSTPQVALATSVLYLVPGIPFLNSFSDMLYRHYICAYGRFADAVVLTACLSAGLFAAMLLMNVPMFQ